MILERLSVADKDRDISHNKQAPYLSHPRPQSTLDSNIHLGNTSDTAASNPLTPPDKLPRCPRPVG